MNTDQMTPTPTPRTDALEQTYRDTGSVLPWNAINLARDLERQLAAERALADRLAGCLELTLAGWDSAQWVAPIDPAEVEASDEALDAWKEARGA